MSKSKDWVGLPFRKDVTKRKWIKTYIVLKKKKETKILYSEIFFFKSKEERNIFSDKIKREGIHFEADEEILKEILQGKRKWYVRHLNQHKGKSIRVGKKWRWNIFLIFNQFKR